MPPAKPSDALRQMIGGCLVTQLIYVVAKIGIADRLAGGPRTADQLAAATAVHPQGLYRVLRALASLGVFTEDAQARFSLTEVAGPLRSDAPDSLHALALLWGEVLWPTCGALLHSVRTGQPAFEHLHGMGVFEYLHQHPQSAEIFDRAMTNLTRRLAPAVVAAYDFGSFGTLVDVGGGQGTLLSAALRAHPQLKGVLYDRAEVLASARRTLAGEGVLERCELVRSDFFASVPEGGDAYLLKDILHDWEDARAVAILKNCARAMKPDSRLLVVERSLPEQNVPGPAKLVDITMLAVTGGRERSEEEYAELFRKAGLRLTRAVATASEMQLFEGAAA